MTHYHIRTCTQDDAATVARHRVEMFREMGEVPTDDLARELLDKSTLALAAGLTDGTYVGWLAGINRMAVGPFLLWNLAGAAAWTLTFATLGYVLGRNWVLIERIFKVLGYGGGALVAAAVIAYLVYRRRRAAVSPTPAEDTDADTSRDTLTSGTSRS